MQEPFNHVACKARNKRFRARARVPGSKRLVTCAIVLSVLCVLQSRLREDGILIYVPVHHESFANLGDFASCMTQVIPVIDGRRLSKRVDFLLLTNGDSELDPSGAADAQRALWTLKKGLPQVSRIRTVHIIVNNDRYDKKMTNSKWVAGPNEVFYRSMTRKGDVYQKYIKPGRYSVIHQLEVDVCPVRDGWLSSLVAEVEGALKTLAVISGPRVDASAVCSSDAAGTDQCTASDDLPDYVRLHVNGNAMYRTGDKLQDLLKSTLDLYPDWPFDLAVYLAANATNQLHLLRYSKFVHNRVVPVYFEHAYNPALYHQSTHLVHCPLAYKKLQMLDAVVATLSTGLPAVVIGACRHMHPDVLRNLQLSMQRQGIQNVVWASGSDDPTVLKAIMRMLLVSYAESVDQRRSPTTGRCAPPLDVIDHLVSRGHDVFYMDADAVVRGNLTKQLTNLDQTAVHFASGAVQSHGHFFPNEAEPRYRFTAKAFYVPKQVAWLALCNAWREEIVRLPRASPDDVINTAANCTKFSACRLYGVPIQLLAPEEFVSGTNVLKLWPSKQAVMAATVHIDVARAFADSSIMTQALNRRRARFSMQQIRTWLLPRDKMCCSTVLLADEFKVIDSASTVQMYVNLLLRMNKTSWDGNIACVAPPLIHDMRTGEKSPFDIIFDPTHLFPKSRLFPSLIEVPVCHGARIYNASVDDTSSKTQHWPLEVFSQELRGALEHVSRSPLLAETICIDDTTRSAAEAALHVLRGSAASVLSPVANHSRVYLMGRWRLLDEHVRQQLPNVLTLLSPEFYPDVPPSSFYSSFGMRSHYSRLGEDMVMDVLDSLVCRLARNATATPENSRAMTMNELYARIFEFIEPDVLAEEMAITQMYDTHIQSPFLIPLDSLENNGFSNLINEAQVLAFSANKLGLRATMPSLSMKHLVNQQRPWSDVVKNVSRLYVEMKSLRPSTWAVLRHPSLLIEVLDGYMLPVGAIKKWSYDAPSLRQDDPWRNVALSLHSRVTFRRIYVAYDEAEWESMRLRGHDVLLGEKPSYLGLADHQIKAIFGSSHASGLSRDVVFRPFRAFNFQNNNIQHAAFAKSWRNAFEVPPHIQVKVQQIVQRLAPNFTCYHARVADEFLVQHDTDRPHFKKENVFNVLAKLVNTHEAGRANTSAPGVYITSDINARIDEIMGRPTQAATSCHAFGCPMVKDDVTWGLIEREVCASARDFFGNIYSTFTLSICSRRNDQPCRDAFNQSLSDGRLLF